MPADRILVLGGSGFVGRHVVNRLVADGYRVTVPTRARWRAQHLYPLPTVDLIETDVHDETVLARLATDALAVINLVGILNASGGDTFDRVHVELTRKIVDACRAVAVRRYIHMSALHADANGPSRYLRSKAEAEAIVASSGLDWTILQPSIIFGRGDAFLNLFARLARLLPVLAIGGANARFQPVHVGDVALCIVRALTLDATVNQRYPLCGPKVYTLRELVRYAAELSGVRRPIVALGPGLARLQAFALEHLPGQLMTRDNLASMQRDSTCDGPFPAVFGIAPAALEAIAPGYLSPESIHSRFDEYRGRSGR